MSDELAAFGDKSKPVPVGPDTIKFLLEHPLRALPAEVRPAALLVWTTHRHLKGLESPLSISTTVGLWLAEYGLRSDDAVAILRSMCSPEAMSTAGYTSDLMTLLATKVNAQIRLRRDEAERVEFKARQDAENKNNLPPDQVRAEIRKVFSKIQKG